MVFPLVMFISNCARLSMTPHSESPPTTINKPTKNIIVLHSTLLIISFASCLPIINIIHAPDKAIIEDSIFNLL